MNYKLVLTNNPNPDDIHQIQQGLNRYNDQILKEHPQEFAIFIRNEDNSIHGGIFALAYSDSLHIILIWVDDSLKRKGFGTQLLRAAEDEAIKRKCRTAYVDTFAFQAEVFYKKNGYRCIGKIPDLLLGHARFFFRKDLLAAHTQIKPKIENCHIQMIEPLAAERICREITATLPEWFGIPEANERYAQGMLERTSIAAVSDNYIGMITLEFPYSNNANIYWMAVKKDFHGKNIGTSLLHAAEDYCRERGCDSMTVETLSQKHCDKNYLKTYKFYEDMGFRPLFELNPYGPLHTMVYMCKILMV